LPLDQNISRAHAPEIKHQRKSRIVAHRDSLAIDDRQRKTGALQNAAKLADVGERRDARRDTALDFNFGGGKCRAQFGQAVSADQCR